MPVGSGRGERRDQALADKILTPDVVWHYPGMTDEGTYDPDRITAKGPEEAKQRAEGLRAFYPDLVLTDEDEIAEGDRVVIRWTLQGTAQVEAGGILVTVTGIDIFRIQDAQLAELWQQFDELGLNQQREEMPAMPSMGTPTSSRRRRPTRARSSPGPRLYLSFHGQAAILHNGDMARRTPSGPCRPCTAGRRVGAHRPARAADLAGLVDPGGVFPVVA
jgi:predicted ester cyclase